MARCDRFDEYDRCVRTHYSLVDRAPGEPWSLYAARFSHDRYYALADRQCHGEDGQWLPLRATPVRTCLFPAGLRHERQSRGGVVSLAESVHVVDARRLGQAEHGDSLKARNSAFAEGKLLRVNVKRSAAA